MPSGSRQSLNIMDEHETVEGAPQLKDEHLPVFDCAFKPANGSRSIHYIGHLKMIGAVQPFISGSISKTMNMPTEAQSKRSCKPIRRPGSWAQGGGDLP